MNWGWSGVHGGDTLYFSGGSDHQYYYERYENSFGNPSTNRLTIRVGQDAGHDGWVIFSNAPLVDLGSDYTTVDGSVNGQSHWAFINATNWVQGTAAGGFSGTGTILRYLSVTNCYNGFGAQNCNQLEVDHCVFWGIMNEWALETTGGNNGTNQFDVNFIHDSIFALNCDMTGNGTGPDGVQSCPGTTISNCYFTHILGSTGDPASAQHSDEIQNNSVWTKVVNCTFENITDSGIQNQGGVDHLWFWNNVFKFTQTMSQPTGFRTYAIHETPSNLHDLLIVNNTFVDQAECTVGAFPISIGAWNNANPSAGSFIIANNIFVNCGHAAPPYAVLYATGSRSISSLDYGANANLFYAGRNGSVSLQGIVSPNSVFGQSPAFASYAPKSPANDFHLLASDTAARGNGTNLTALFLAIGLPTTDHDGNPRPASGAWDIGAYQSGSGRTSGALRPPPVTGVHVLHTR